MTFINRIIFFSFCFTCCLITSAYSDNITLSLRLVHPDNDRITYSPPSEVKIDKKVYEYFVMGNEHYWVSTKLEADISDMMDAKISVITPPTKEEVGRLSKQYPNTSFSLEPSFNVTITFNQKGQEKLRKVTENNIGRRLAVIFNGKILIAPIIQEKITGGEVIVSGFSNYDEAKKISDAIKSSSK